jgi:hypothetical protein
MFLIPTSQCGVFTATPQRAAAVSGSLLNLLAIQLGLTLFASGHKGIIRMLGARARRLLPHLGSCAWFRQQVDFYFEIVDFQQFKSDIR